MIEWLARFCFYRAMVLTGWATRKGYDTEEMWERLKRISCRHPWIWPYAGE